MAIKGMSKGNLNPDGCDTGIVRQTAANGVPWVHRTVRASIDSLGPSCARAWLRGQGSAWGHCAQAIEERQSWTRGRREHGNGRRRGCPQTPTHAGALEPLPPVDDSPEMSRGKLDIMCDEGLRGHQHPGQPQPLGYQGRHL
jgi:hypothetical protein